MRTVSLTLRGALLGAGLLAAACGKATATSAEVNPSQPAPTPSTPVQAVNGRASAGPVANGTVEVFLVSDTGANAAALGSGQTDSTGAFNLTVSASPNALLSVEVHSGTYNEEATGTPVTITAPIRTLIAAQSAASIGVTPLTEIAVQRALATAGDANSFAEAVTNAQFAMSQATGLADITRAPANPNAPIADPNSQGAKYALMLAGLSQLAASSNINSLQLAGALATNFNANGTLDPGPLAAATVIHRADGTTTTLSPTAWSTQLPAATSTFLTHHGAAIGLSTLSLTTITATPALVHPDLAHPDPAPTGLTLADANAGSIAAGTSDRITATATFAAGTSRNFSQQVAWSSSNPAAAIILPSGVAVGIAPGTTVITATDGSLHASLPLTVTAATLTSLAVTDARLGHMAVGTTDQLLATGTFTDGSTQNMTSQASFSSSATAEITVSSQGLMTSHAAGNANIVATVNALSATLPMTVTTAGLTSLSMTPLVSGATTTLAAGTALPLAILGVFSDGSQQPLAGAVSFASSASGIATVNATTGVVHGVAAGTVVITGSFAALSVPLSVTVTAAPLTSLALTAPQLSGTHLAASTTAQLVATGSFSDSSHQLLTGQVTSWVSSSPSFITVSPAGLVTAVAAGASTITATGPGGMTGTLALTATAATVSSIAVTVAGAAPPATVPALPNGIVLPLMATATFSDSSTQDVSKQATWTSTVPATVSVSTQGLITALTASSSSNVTAAFGGQTSTAVAVTTNAATLSSIALTDALGGTVAHGLTDQWHAVGSYSNSTTFDLTRMVNWTVSNSAAGSISATGLFAAGSAAGTTNVTATLGATTMSGPLVVQ